ncbi:MAG: tRNA lysidine(34) synthetase TilS [Acidimicrobiia bacterium]
MPVRRCEGVDLDGLVAPVVVACSGGPDSLALLVLGAEAGLDPIAVHVDHGLRPESAAEADVVRDAAHRLGVDVRCVQVDVGLGGNLEARARDARYSALETVRAELGATAVLVAHTADDQAETVLLNLLRGSGARGLAGMPVRRGHVVRPLLGVRRADVHAVCAERGLSPVVDPSNDDRVHRRNWVRLDALPALCEGARRDLVPVLNRQAAVLRAEADLLDELADALLETAGAEAPSARAISGAHPALARRAVRRWLGTPPPSLAEVERVLEVARCERRAAQLSGGRRVWREAGALHQAVPWRP